MIGSTLGEYAKPMHMSRSAFCLTGVTCARADELKAAIAGCTSTCVHINGSDIRDWDVSRITEMDQLFQYNSKFNANISAWNTSSVTSFA